MARRDNGKRAGRPLREPSAGGFVSGMGTPDGLVRITPRLAIPLTELSFRATTGGGPGGQHVNRSATRIELRWNLLESPSLSEPQRARLRERLAHRLDARGTIRLVAGARRSQAANRDEAVRRFARLVAGALHVAPPRKPTRPTAASRRRRLADKRRRADRKRDRRRVDRNDE